VRTGFFDLFKIGLGPSSSHTTGPMRAAGMFAAGLAERGLLDEIESVQVELYGSLALTGKGHGTDRAVVLGLSGMRPEETEPEPAARCVETVERDGALLFAGTHRIAFSMTEDIVFLRREVLPRHPNAMRISARFTGGAIAEHQTYYSVGGGFVEVEGAPPSADDGGVSVPYSFASAAELLAIGEREGLAIWEIVLANESARHGETEVRAYVDTVWGAMQTCAQRGLQTEGILPGGLNVRRRAPQLYRRLHEKSGGDDALAPMDYVNAVAMAVNEENAAGGRVVTAPTNGAAGVIPAVAHYYLRYVKDASGDGLFRFFLTASAIGALYKENASISGAEVGCQGEVGVACSMAAGALVAALGGANHHVEHAAEIGMEHSLGMTCDPIGGLVQIPCIERNAVGAMKAIHAARMAMWEDEGHAVTLDAIIDVMYRTGLDMQTKYKETSLGGLAVGVVEC
jgi:L-serine dehydratase